MYKTIIFSVFVLFCFLLVGITAHKTDQEQILSTEATSFSVSPPLIFNDELRPGDMHSQDIRVMRSFIDDENFVEFKIDAPEIEDWIRLDPENGFIFTMDRLTEKMQVVIEVPSTVRPGDYQGKIVFYMKAPGSEKKRIGGKVEISLRVLSTGDRVAYKELPIVDDSEYERLQGWIVLKTADNQKPYYISPQKKELLYIGDQESLERIVARMAVGVTNQDLAKISTRENKLENDDFDMNLTNKLRGQFLIQVEEDGELWYVSPSDNLRYSIDISTDGLDVLYSLASGLDNDGFDNLVGYKN